MAGRPRISIVTPSFNQGHFIEEGIHSVFQQDYPNFEHIIIDGASTDETMTLLKRYSHLVWRSESDRGQADAMNKGFQMVTGDIIGWLNADDRYLPGCFNAVELYFMDYPEIDIVYGDYRLINAAGEVKKCRRELDFDLFMLKYLHMLYIPSTTTFFRRKVIDDGNLLDLTYHYAMDYEFVLRLALKGYKFGHIPKFLADFRRHSESKSSVASMNQRIEQERALLKYEDWLRKIDSPLVRKGARSLLELIARGKRYFLKGVRGYYLSNRALL